jgi:hypothetical protein
MLVLTVVTASCTELSQGVENNPKAVLGILGGAALGGGIAALAGGGTGALVLADRQDNGLEQSRHRQQRFDHADADLPARQRHLLPPVPADHRGRRRAATGVRDGVPPTRRDLGDPELRRPMNCRRGPRRAFVCSALLLLPVIDQDGYRQLTWFVDKMQPYLQANFLVQGFADTTDTEAGNQQLSVDRAQAVAQFLSGQGIAPSRMDVQGFGTTSPADSNATAQGRRNNRRVEVTVR